MRFESATITDIRRETADSLLIGLHTPPAFADDFQSGQHLTIKADINGKETYRTYSICQPAFYRQMEIGVRIVPNGLMSGYLAKRQSGDTLQVAKPIGAFYLRLPQANTAHNALFIAGGSGITPIIGMLEALMIRRPQSRATLFYANRTLSSTMFFERLMQTKNRFMDRLDTHLFFTREQPPVDWRARRIDAETLDDLTKRSVLCGESFDAGYLCGPTPMMDSCHDFLRDRVPNIYSEAFGAPLSAAVAKTPRQTAASPPIARLQITIGGARREFDFCADDDSVLTAANRCGIALPFSCTGGVCGTCRAKVLDGKAKMANNYALEEDDLNNGFVLSCQAKPLSDSLSLSFDY